MQDPGPVNHVLTTGVPLSLGVKGPIRMTSHMTDFSHQPFLYA